jgi:NIMA-interacting peptidyl-prolyl cis-trans isomerase 1
VRPLFSSCSVLCFIGVLAACGKTEPAPQPAASAAPAPSVAPAAPTPTPTPKVDEPVPESIAVQHVLVAYRGAKGAPKTVKRSKAEAKKLAEQVLSEARGGADYSDLAARYSDDPGAKASRGNLGKRKRDAFVPAFADAAFRLKEGEVSDVVETEFGFHIIKRNQ